MKKFILCFVACCTFLLFGFESNAAVTTVGFAEPMADDNHGYIILEYASGNTAIYFWGGGARSNSTTEFETYDTYVALTITETSVDFQMLTNTASSYMSYYFCRYNSQEKFNVMKQGAVTTGNVTYEYTTSDTIVGFTVKGNVGRIDSTIKTTNTNPVFVFGNDRTPIILNSILTALNSVKTNVSDYLPKLNTILSEVQSLDTSVNNIETDVDYIAGSMSDLYELVDQLLDDMNSNHAEIVEQNQAIYDELYDLKEQLIQNDGSMNDFEDSSNEQSSQLNDLNQDTQVEKPDIDNMSNSVDENLDIDVDANYGLLLSTFTTNNRILTMLLIVASFSLISYVFFGKR